MGFRNLPTDEARPIVGLIESRQGQVSSMALASSGAVDFMLMAFSAGESVSEEEYFGDTLYHVVEGAAWRLLPVRCSWCPRAFRMPSRVMKAPRSNFCNLRFLKRVASDGTN